jgi:hypothetical protein
MLSYDWHPQTIPKANDVQIFLQSVLYSPPTVSSLEQAKKFLLGHLSISHLKVDVFTRSLLNHWIELAESQLSKAGQVDIISILDHERIKLPDILAEVTKNQQVCCTIPIASANGASTNVEWKYVTDFRPKPKSFKRPIKVFTLKTIKNTAFGKIKRGELVEQFQPNAPYTLTEQFVAMKTSNIALSQQGVRAGNGDFIFENAEKELAILSILDQFQHRYIISLIQFGTDSNFLYTITPLGRISLWDKLIQGESLSPTSPTGGILPFLHQLRKQIGSALAFLHSIGFAHRDVSLENIIEMNDGSFKLIDFGLACSLTLQDTHQGRWLPIPLDYRNGEPFAVGKGRYLAPEVFLTAQPNVTPNQQEPSFRYDAQKADVFALGISIFVAAFRAFPYQKLYPQAGFEPTIQQLRHFYLNEAEMFFQSHISEEIKWLHRVVARDPQLRLTAWECCLWD